MYRYDSFLISRTFFFLRLLKLDGLKRLIAFLKFCVKLEGEEGNCRDRPIRGEYCKIRIKICLSHTWYRSSAMAKSRMTLERLNFTPRELRQDEKSIWVIRSLISLGIKAMSELFILLLSTENVPLSGDWNKDEEENDCGIILTEPSFGWWLIWTYSTVLVSAFGTSANEESGEMRGRPSGCAKRSWANVTDSPVIKLSQQIFFPFCVPLPIKANLLPEDIQIPVGFSKSEGRSKAVCVCVCVESERERSERENRTSNFSHISIEFHYSIVFVAGH